MIELETRQGPPPAAPASRQHHPLIALMLKYQRKLLFASVGVFGMFVGYATLFLCVHMMHWNASVSYVIQTIVSVLLNFLLNYSLTWRDRREKSVVRQFGRFITARIVVTIPLNQALFNLLIALHLQYLIANTACVAITMVYSYFVADKWTHGSLRLRDIPSAIGRKFGRKTTVATANATRGPATDSATATHTTPQYFTVVIPTKGNKGSVAETVAALLSQDYPFNPEIIVVGDPNDSAWEHLKPFGARVKCIALDVTSPGRDSNAKRLKGLQHASIVSTVLAVMDDDVIPRLDWMQTVNDLLQGHIHAAAGPVTGLGTSFWTRYIDENPMARKMPSAVMQYVLNPRSLKRHKPPVTANFAITRELYERVGGPDPAFTNSYEDYSWMARMIHHGGFSILCTSSLACTRYHREGLRPLVREYMRSGRGCADYIATFRKECAFAQKRVSQLKLFYVLLVLGLATISLEPIATVALGGCAAVLLAAATAIRVRKLEATAYPFLSLLLGLMFIFGLSKRLATSKGLIAPVVHGTEFIRHELHDVVDHIAGALEPTHGQTADAAS